VVLRVFPWLGVALVTAACGNVLGYDELSFEDGGTGAAGSGGVSSGGSGAIGSGGSATGGNAGTSGAGTGGVGTGGAGTAGTGGGGTGGAANGGTGGAASGGTGGGSTGGSGGSTGDPYATARQQCVDKINEYRATLSLPPYQRWNAKESCADGEAKSDSETGKAHGAFPSCGEWAQNECPGYGSVNSTVTTCLAQMWAEGPGADFQTHGHYINMSSTKYTKVACGFYETPTGSVWAVQDFQ
jgi:hypothetical protein